VASPTETITHNPAPLPDLVATHFANRSDVDLKDLTFLPYAFEGMGNVYKIIVTGSSVDIAAVETPDGKWHSGFFPKISGETPEDERIKLEKRAKELQTAHWMAESFPTALSTGALIAGKVITAQNVYYRKEPPQAA
jgi:hypothetical protein